MRLLGVFLAVLATSLAHAGSGYLSLPYSNNESINDAISRIDQCLGPLVDPLCMGGVVDSGENGGAVMNVRAPMFGAIGNGLVDDAPAFQRVATLAAQLKGTVFIPPGRYLLASTITFTDTTVQGVSTLGSALIGHANLAGSPMLIATDTIHNGAIHQTRLKNFGVFCHGSGQAKGRHPSTLIDGIRLDASTDLEDVRIQYCDKGLVTNANAGHQQVINGEFLNNYYGIYFTIDNGNFHCLNCQSAGSSFAALGIATNVTADGTQLLGGDFGFSPYGIWQEGSTTKPFLNDVVLDGVAFEAIGNAMAFSANVAAGGTGGQVTNLTINNAGYSDAHLDATFNLDEALCVGAGDPYQCCTGAGTGCDDDVAFVAGVCAVWKVKNGSHPLYTPTGGASAVSCTQCQGEMQFTKDTGAVYDASQIACGTHQEFVHVRDGGGGWNWNGYTPTDTPPPCVTATSRGHTYYDLSLERLCYCNGTSQKWCQVDSPATCGSSSSCN